jgi:hypothetical protein
LIFVLKEDLKRKVVLVEVKKAIPEPLRVNRAQVLLFFDACVLSLDKEFLRAHQFDFAPIIPFDSVLQHRLVDGITAECTNRIDVFFESTAYHSEHLVF